MDFPEKNTAIHFVFDVWLVFGSILKFVHIEIISLWIKTIVNFSPVKNFFLSLKGQIFEQ